MALGNKMNIHISIEDLENQITIAAAEKIDGKINVKNKKDEDNKQRLKASNKYEPKTNEEPKQHNDQDKEIGM